MPSPQLPYKLITVGGEEIPAGKYALFTIPGEKEWTIIINRNWVQHLADNYSEEEDLMRFKVKPESESQHQERLRYQIIPGTEHTGSIQISCDKLSVTLPVSA